MNHKYYIYLWRTQDVYNLSYKGCTKVIPTTLSPFFLFNRSKPAEDKNRREGSITTKKGDVYPLQPPVHIHPSVCICLNLLSDEHVLMSFLQLFQINYFYSYAMCFVFGHACIFYFFLLEIHLFPEDQVYFPLPETNFKSEI